MLAGESQTHNAATSRVHGPTCLAHHLTESHCDNVEGFHLPLFLVLIPSASAYRDLLSFRSLLNG